MIEQTGDLSAIHHSNSLKKIVLDIFKLNVRNGKNKLFLPTSHLFVNLVERNAVQKQVLNPTRDTEDTKESHHCYQWTCHQVVGYRVKLITNFILIALHYVTIRGSQYCSLLMHGVYF